MEYTGTFHHQGGLNFFPVIGYNGVMKVLLYSFEPSTPGHTNSGLTTAEWIMEGLNSEYPEVVESKLVVLPPYFSSQEKMRRKLDNFKPDVVIGLHVAPGKPWVLVEQCALNIIHTHRCPNWADRQCYMTPIYQNGASALFTSLDTVTMVNTLRENGVPAEHSFHCGTGIANYAYYITLEEMKLIHTVFLHVPQAPEEAIVQDRPLPVFPPWQTAQGIVRWLCGMCSPEQDREGDQS